MSPSHGLSAPLGPSRYPELITMSRDLTGRTLHPTRGLEGISLRGVLGFHSGEPLLSTPSSIQGRSVVSHLCGGTRMGLGPFTQLSKHVCP